MALSSVTPYATVAEADVILGTVEPWDSATSEEKESALVQGKLYMDATYLCIVPDQANPPEALIEGNSLLANAQLSESLWERQDGLGPLASVDVAAGSVSSKKSYAVSATGTWKDPFPEVTSLVGGYCSLTQGSAVVKPLVRR